MSSHLHVSGVRFIEYLRTSEERISVHMLRDFYNEFRGRVHPSFSKVLNALVSSNKIFIEHSIVYLIDEPQPREYCDQRRRPRAPRRQNPICGPEEPAAPSPGPSTAVAPALTSRNLASRVLKELQVNRKMMMADKKGIEITSNPESSEGKVQYIVETLREKFLIRFHIENKGPDAINFTYYTALPRNRCFTLEDEKRVTRACPVSLNPGESYEVVARYKLKYHGYFSAMIYFEFLPVDTKSASDSFSIVREMVAATRTPLAAELGPVAPYEPLRRFAHKPGATMLVQVEFPERHRHVYVVEEKVKLGDYKCPQYLKRLVKQNLEDSENLSPADRSKLATVKSHLRGPLEMKNYFHRFNHLLHLEEMQMEVELRKFNLRNQTMTRDQSNRKLLTLKVPGVAEDRPSVLRGGYLKVSKSGDTSEPLPVYRGKVHKVELDSVKLSFSQKLLEVFNSNMKFDVEFTLNQYTLMLQHRAVDLAAKYNLEDVLFPSGAAATNPSLPPSLPTLRMFYRDLENNPEQRAAVQHIVAGSSKPAPYLVFGPPGTGKTSTLVEAMYQVIMADPSAHILACAPSNSACDLLLERLMEPMDRQLVYRVYADSRDPRSVPEHLLKYCNLDKNQQDFVFPGKEILMNFKIVVTTMFTAGRLVSKGIPVGHFTHVFVDEGGQAEEPQCVIAVAGLLNPQKGQLVLAGDPMQLGPIIQSRLALHHGLGLSLLERLMKYNDLYKTSKDPRFVTKLQRNYRSHAAILKIPNELFYDNEVQEFADQCDREAYCNWEHLPKKGFPVIFHGVIGKDEREANSPSFFNVSEIEVIVDYLTKLMETQEKNGLPKLSAKDIGIIAPYRKQVEKIQKALKSAAALRQWSEVKEIKVGCVEAFQGDERKIIMVSTVRSSINCVKMDKDFNIGFLSNPKRFNVAVTRAGSLLIVVGNPVILNKDPTWEKFISYCVKEKGYTGLDLKDIESEDYVVLTLAALNI
ncbi:putative helicase mov-10-B.1 isoform X2 [Hippoglossus stenolepis]|uniref:putative helicase mov-10-B.1 isoform X2 n=1 Tax=Hippoglossus stenolepis TaxID=195615 RepID=UPI001FAF7DA0|nr:putative helicase mov-10-B.1 isoform X2 [Hippoglossus stenolepis]